MNKTVAVWCVIIGLAGMTSQSKPITSKRHHYTVAFTGIDGAQVYGNAGWHDTSKGIYSARLNKAQGVLPITTELSPPPGAVVTATGISDEQNQLIIKIYRDGIECGEDVISGNAGITSLICRQE